MRGLAGYWPIASGRNTVFRRGHRQPPIGASGGAEGRVRRTFPIDRSAPVLMVPRVVDDLRLAGSDPAAAAPARIKPPRSDHNNQKWTLLQSPCRVWT